MAIFVRDNNQVTQTMSRENTPMINQGTMSQPLSTKNTASLPAASVLCVQFLKFKLEYLLWMRPFHTAENQYPIPAVCKTATVMPNRPLSRIPISTSLTTTHFNTHLNNLDQYFVQSVHVHVCCCSVCAGECAERFGNWWCSCFIPCHTLSAEKWFSLG